MEQAQSRAAQLTAEIRQAEERAATLRNALSVAGEAPRDDALFAELPDKVRHRITNSHFEIDALCRYLRTLDLSQCREIYLLHLSDAMSSEGKFLNRVRRCAPMGVRVAACPREQVISGPKDAKNR